MGRALASRGVRRFVAPHLRHGRGRDSPVASRRRRFAATLARLVPALTAADLVPGGSGVRAMALTPAARMLDDFHFVETAAMVHVLNAPSPAATASLAIGETVAGRVTQRVAAASSLAGATT